MEMMDSREELSEAARKKDTRAIKRLEAAMAGRRDAALAALAAGFDAAEGDVEKLKLLLPKLGELRYMRRFLDEVSALEEELVPADGTA
jgi:molecular chaperone HscB